MKTLPLTQGKIALVDDETFEWLNQYKWSAHKGKGKWYAIRAKRINGKCNIIYLHRFIMQPKDNTVIDHIDGDGLNCQKCNMRICSQSQNMQNSDCKHSNKGVGLTTGSIKFTAQIHIHGKKIHLGCYTTEKEAAVAYNLAAIKYFGEFARLNTIT
jgi:hypothetical protein